MPTLLRIDASARREGSHSRDLADHFQRRWSAAHPGGRVILRDLAAAPVPHLHEDTIRAFQHAGPESVDPAEFPAAELALSDELIAELNAADDVLIVSPLYNFAVPSPLKAYIDHIVRPGRTFRWSDQGPVGLIRGHRAILITARGGRPHHDAPDDFQTPFLETALRFIGFTAIDHIGLNDTAAAGGVRDAAVAGARAQVDLWFDSREGGREPEWVGAFDTEDRRQIDTLRRAQACAIEAGDAMAYANLCADNIHLMIPGHDVVAGRDQLLATQTRLFGTTKFPRLTKRPLRIERSGDLAVEVGRQELDVPLGDARAGVFSRRQKYTHVFRLTPEGWRFAVLMSNPSH